MHLPVRHRLVRGRRLRPWALSPGARRLRRGLGQRMRGVAHDARGLRRLWHRLLHLPRGSVMCRWRVCRGVVRCRPRRLQRGSVGRLRGEPRHARRLRSLRGSMRSRRRHRPVCVGGLRDRNMRPGLRRLQRRSGGRLRVESLIRSHVWSVRHELRGGPGRRVPLRRRALRDHMYDRDGRLRWRRQQRLRAEPPGGCSLRWLWHPVRDWRRVSARSLYSALRGPTLHTL